MSLSTESPPPGPADEPHDPGATSPCTSICRLNEGDLCVGCGRTVDEIIGWTRMSDAEKIATNRRAADRRRTLGDP